MKRLVSLLLLGCTGDPVVLADLAEDAPAGAGVRCAATADCDAADYCDKSACSEAAGTCHTVPVHCGGEQKPVCGCDGVTYFNTCLRRAAGVEADVPGECDHGARCAAAADCPAGAECARLIGSDAARCEPPPPKGSCWVLPVACDASPDRWDSCGAGPDRCVDTCAAIRTGTPHKRTLSCK